MENRKNVEVGILMGLGGVILSIYRASCCLELSAVCLIAALVCPVVFTPFTWLWFKLTELLARLVNPVVLTVVFFLVVVPVAIVRKIMINKPNPENVSSTFSDAKNSFFTKDDLIDPW